MSSVMTHSSRRRIARLATLSLIALPTVPTPSGRAFAQTPATVASPVPPKPKITAKQAEASAVKKIPGKVVSSKYEFEDGHWQYAVVVTDKKGQMYEVEVNSTTGKVTDSEKTSAAEEAKEEAADKKKAQGKAAPKPASKEKEKDEDDEKGEKPGK